MKLISIFIAVVFFNLKSTSQMYFYEKDSLNFKISEDNPVFKVDSANWFIWSDSFIIKVELDNDVLKTEHFKPMYFGKIIVYRTDLETADLIRRKEKYYKLIKKL